MPSLCGISAKVLVFVIPPRTKTETVEQEIDDDGNPETPPLITQVEVTTDSTIQQADALKNAATLKFNYICHPTGSAQDQNDLAEWIKLQRRTKYKTIK